MLTLQVDAVGCGMIQRVEQQITKLERTPEGITGRERDETSNDGCNDFADVCGIATGSPVNNAEPVGGDPAQLTYERLSGVSIRKFRNAWAGTRRHTLHDGIFAQRDARAGPPRDSHEQGRS